MTRTAEDGPTLRTRRPLLVSLAVLGHLQLLVLIVGFGVCGPHDPGSGWQRCYATAPGEFVVAHASLAALALLVLPVAVALHRHGLLPTGRRPTARAVGVLVSGGLLLTLWSGVQCGVTPGTTLLVTPAPQQPPPQRAPCHELAPLQPALGVAILVAGAVAAAGFDFERLRTAASRRVQGLGLGRAVVAFWAAFLLDWLPDYFPCWDAPVGLSWICPAVYPLFDVATVSLLVVGVLGTALGARRVARQLRRWAAGGE